MILLEGISYVQNKWSVLSWHFQTGELRDEVVGCIVEDNITGDNCTASYLSLGFCHDIEAEIFTRNMECYQQVSYATRHRVHSRHK